MEQQPGIDKKAIAAILLCAVIWAVWMNMSYRRNQQAAAQKAAQATPVAAASPATTGDAAVTGTPVEGATPAVAAATPAPARTVTLENEHLALTLSSNGARPVGADLKEERYHISEKAGERVLSRLVPAESDGKVAALSPWFGDAAASRIPPDAPFAVTASGGGAVTFTWTGNDGLTLERRYEQKDRYTLALTETYKNAGSQPITGRPGVVWAARDKKGSTYDVFQTAAAVANRFQSDRPDEPGEEELYSGKVEYVAVHDRYFVGAVAPAKPAFDAKDSVRLRRTSEETLAAIAVGESVTIAPGQSLTLTHDLYVGPKDYSILREQPHHLGWVMDWGTGQGIFWRLIGVITKGLWYALRWLHGLLGNWGVAIIVLTFIMRGLLWPIAARQMRTANEFSMKVQKLKPQLDKLREKHADDPMEMNRQTMVLYKQHGVSPFSPLAGCLPLLAQLPIWWALYALLNTSIDLRGAPFMLWIDDLSRPETLFKIGTFDFRLMPLLLGAVTWLQMKLTPNAGADPVQQKMMMWMMPTMFVFFMWSLPAGLVVYIFTSTLVGIIQQWWLKRGMTKPPEPPALTTREATS